MPKKLINHYLINVLILQCHLLIQVQEIQQLCYMKSLLIILKTKMFKNQFEIKVDEGGDEEGGGDKEDKEIEGDKDE